MNDSLIIDSPQRQGYVRRITQGALTAAMWLLWFYLLLPIFEPALKMAGVNLADMGLAAKVVDLQPFALAVLFVGTVILGFWLWVGYNVLLYRFRSNTLSQHNDVGHLELANSFGICPQALSSWQHSDLLVIRHTEQGSICSVEEGKLKVFPFIAQRSANESRVRGNVLQEEMMRDEMLAIPKAS